jgi:hypothetical protein
LKDQNRKLVLENQALQAEKEVKEKENVEFEEEVKEKQGKIDDLKEKLCEYKVRNYKVVQDVYNKVYGKDQVIDKEFKLVVDLKYNEKDREFSKELSKILLFILIKYENIF